MDDFNARIAAMVQAIRLKHALELSALEMRCTAAIAEVIAEKLEQSGDPTLRVTLEHAFERWITASSAIVTEAGGV